MIEEEEERCRLVIRVGFSNPFLRNEKRSQCNKWLNRNAPFLLLGMEILIVKNFLKLFQYFYIEAIVTLFN
jgi:hypothetical protein